MLHQFVECHGYCSAHYPHRNALDGAIADAKKSCDHPLNFESTKGGEAIVVSYWSDVVGRVVVGRITAFPEEEAGSYPFNPLLK